MTAPEHLPAPLLTCPLCGTRGALHDLRAEALGLACDECGFEGSEAELLAAVDRRNVEEWAAVPLDVRALLVDADAGHPLRAVAAELLAAGTAPARVELLVRGLNELRRREGHRAVPEVEAVRIVREVAGSLARSLRATA